MQAPRLCSSHMSYSWLYADYDRTRRSARGAREDVKDGYQDAKNSAQGTYYNAKDDIKDGYQDAKNSAQGTYYDAKDSVKDSYYDTKKSVKGTWNDAKDSVEDTYNDAKDSVRETKQSIKNKYNETNRDINRNIEHAKQSWQDSLTPHSYVSVLQANDWDCNDLPEHQCAPFFQLTGCHGQSKMC